MLSDSYFKAPTDKMIKLLLQRNIKTYTYVLNSTLDGLKPILNHGFNILGNGRLLFIALFKNHFLNKELVFSIEYF